MTENQKKRITKLRQQGFGYATIASELRIPVGTVKTFCRRNNLQAGDLASGTQPENISASSPEIDLISAGSRGNSTSKADRTDRGQDWVQGAHQIQDLTEAVPRSGVILTGDFSAGYKAPQFLFANECA